MKNVATGGVLDINLGSYLPDCCSAPYGESGTPSSGVLPSSMVLNLYLAHLKAVMGHSNVSHML